MPTLPDRPPLYILTTARADTTGIVVLIAVSRHGHCLNSISTACRQRVRGRAQPRHQVARRSPDVARRIHKVDNERIRLIERIFCNLGFRGVEAHIRARVTYYHQVGYYALAVHESRSARRRLTPMYALALSGRKL